MKLAAALYALAFSPCVLAAPVSMMHDRVLSQADAFNSALRQEPSIKLPVKTSNRLAKNRDKKGSKTQRTRLSKGQPLLSSDGVALLAKGPPPKSQSSYLTSLARQWTNKSPFSESSTVREETRASREDWEAEATIVEWETKASRDSYVWIPCFSQGKALRYRRVRIYADMLVVSLVLSFVAVVLVIELWVPAVERLRRFRSGHGPIYLGGSHEAKKASLTQTPCAACGSHIQEPVSESTQEVGIVDEETEKI
ncbi:hypothetical protein F5Y19DRAFT_335464 [Xylariaceae sp. FL1651]|nr:hypothetical protein F5Y19DRAFT_335464 [Xylariaceae sp. FL1651]